MHVADSGNNAIVVYAAGAATPPATVTSGPNQLYVPNATGNNIAVFSLPLTSASVSYTVIGAGMNDPSAITFLTLPI
jgi:hypothetical protein